MTYIKNILCLCTLIITYIHSMDTMEKKTSDTSTQEQHRPGARLLSIIQDMKEKPPENLSPEERKKHLNVLKFIEQITKELAKNNKLTTKE